MQKPKHLNQAVYITICWFDIFNQPVSAEEIHRYLFFYKSSLVEVKKCLKKDKRISKSFGFYFLRGKNALVVRRCQRQYQAGKLWRKAIEKSFLFKWTPFLNTAAVGNTLAMGWPEKSSDIDLVIIDKKNRLFTTRIFLTLFTIIYIIPPYIQLIQRYVLLIHGDFHERRRDRQVDRQMVQCQ